MPISMIMPMEIRGNNDIKKAPFFKKDAKYYDKEAVTNKDEYQKHSKT